jgi:hypothetical protein
MYLSEISANTIESTMCHLLVRDFLHPLDYVLFYMVDHFVGTECFQLCFLFVLSHQIDRLAKRRSSQLHVSCS